MPIWHPPQQKTFPFSRNYLLILGMHMHNSPLPLTRHPTLMTASHILIHIITSFIHTLASTFSSEVRIRPGTYWVHHHNQIFKLRIEIWRKSHFDFLTASENFSFWGREEIRTHTLLTFRSCLVIFLLEKYSIVSIVNIYYQVGTYHIHMEK